MKGSAAVQRALRRRLRREAATLNGQQTASLCFDAENLHDRGACRNLCRAGETVGDSTHPSQHLGWLYAGKQVLESGSLRLLSKCQQHSAGNPSCD